MDERRRSCCVFDRRLACSNNRLIRLGQRGLVVVFGPLLFGDTTILFFLTFSYGF